MSLYAELFLPALRRSPAAVALIADGMTLTYDELASRAAAIAAEIERVAAPEEQFVGVVSGRSVEAFSAILAVAATGRAYVPLNVDFPVARLRYMLRKSSVQTLFVASEAFSILADLLAPAEDARVHET